MIDLLAYVGYDVRDPRRVFIRVAYEGAMMVGDLREGDTLEVGDVLVITTLEGKYRVAGYRPSPVAGRQRVTLERMP